ncbi:uncharacterized protein LOC119771407 isoform X2 [Cyprinodon tularosa]|uniref:uncharacterized protein LOC119771407 isoform X2 n=1 Tax=Cyprinodon tularosa TaxID=77115 RepID=UPI0018E1EB02|nr:uncharacterized protein LOC119771407 isoform X2 [Cyprinodon tularosa]
MMFQDKEWNQPVEVILGYLTSRKVKHIVRCLVDLFSRVGIPKEILTDQEKYHKPQLVFLLLSCFMGDTLEALWTC